MHSCGKVNEVIEPLIEIGCNVIHLQQPRLWALRRSAQGIAVGYVSHSVIFNRAFKDADDIREEAQLLLEWATPEGGILSDYGDGGAIGVVLKSRSC